jgi:hypothetical protein
MSREFIQTVLQASHTAKRLTEVGRQEIIPRIERVNRRGILDALITYYIYYQML